MREKTFIFQDPEQVKIFVYRWSPDQLDSVKGVVQIAHGMTEHAGRYKRFAERLTEAGYMVYANDHRGHGKTGELANKKGNSGRDGLRWMLRNMRQLQDEIKKREGELPVFLFGHSMGSYLTQQYMSEYGKLLKGAILSGTSGKLALLRIGILIAERECHRHGMDGTDTLIGKMLFGGYNRSVKSALTAYDWLSRDEAEVKKYMDDPHCGHEMSAGFYRDFFDFLLHLHQPENMARIPKSLPIYIMGGDRDPLGRFGRSVRKLYMEYCDLGISDVSCRLYEDGRHEMLNETNRDEVMQDIVDWLNARV
jgi:alpha-beta hydrolase superfamily lysophospholipase